MITPGEKSPLPEAQRRVEPATLHHAAAHKATNGSVQTNVSAAILRRKLQITPAISPSHSVLTPGQLGPGLFYNTRLLA